MKCNGNESEPLFSKSAGSAVGPDLMESPGNLRPLFDHLNISDLNLSFSTKGETTAKEKRSQQRALLIKSFAKNHQGYNSNFLLSANQLQKSTSQLIFKTGGRLRCPAFWLPLAAGASQP